MNKTVDYDEKISSIIGSKNSISSRTINKLGKLYVLKELAKKGYTPQWRKRHIYVPELDKRIKVTVSNLKREGEYKDKSIRYWGWAIKRRDNAVIFDFLVAVALNSNVWAPKFFIFSREETDKCDFFSKRFNNIEKGMRLFENETAYISALKERPQDETNPCIVEINTDSRKFLDRWDKIKG